MLFVGANLFSQDWEYVTTGEDNTKYYYKPNTSTTAWIKEESDKIMYYPTNKIQSKKIIEGYQITLYKYDCSDKQMGIIQITTYSKLGKVLKSSKVNEYLVDMNYVIPDSVGESILNSFCNE